MVIGINLLDRKLFVDKRLLAINFDEISLLMSALTCPTPVNVTAILQRLNIPLSKQMLIQELGKPNSIYYQILASILLKEVARCLFLQNQEFEQFLEAVRREEAEDDEIAELKRYIHLIKVREAFKLYEKLTKLNKLLLKLKQPLPTHKLMSIGHFLIDSAASADLKFFLKYAKTEKEARVIYYWLEQYYQKAAKVIQLLNNFQPSSLEEEEWRNGSQERLLYRFSPEGIEQTRRQHTFIDLEDSLVREQYLKGLNTNMEIIEFEASKKIDHPGVAQEVSKDTLSVDSELTKRMSYSHPTMLNKPNGKELSPVEKARRWKLEIFQDKFNDSVSTGMIEGVPNILKMPHVVQDAICNPIEEKVSKVNTEVKNLLDVIKDKNEIEYKNLSQCLTNWSKKNVCESTDESYLAVLNSIKLTSEAQTTLKDAVPKLQEFLKICQNELLNGHQDKIVEDFNTLIKENPMPELDRIRSKLEAIPFIYKFDLKEPMKNPENEFDFN